MTTQTAKPRAITLPRDPQSAASRLAALKPGKPGEETITETAERYMAAIRRSLPNLEHSELCLIFDALGPDWTADEELNQTLSAELSEAIDKDHLDRKWETNGPNLLNRLRRMPYGAQMALGEMNELFWTHSADYETYAETVSACIAMLQPPSQVHHRKRPSRMSPDKAGGAGRRGPKPEQEPHPPEPEIQPLPETAAGRPEPPAGENHRPPATAGSIGPMAMTPLQPA